MLRTRKGIKVMDLKDQLIRDEDEKLYGYLDSKGYMTIGVGHLIDRRRGGYIPRRISRELLDIDIADKTQDVIAALPWVAQLDEARKAVLIGMAFNLGVEGLLEFHRMLAAIQAKDWVTAQKECADPNYVKDVGERAIRYGKQLLTGEWQ
jgi:lysozyme